MPSEQSRSTEAWRFSAMPEDHNAMRYADFDEAEPPALEFNDQASPRALVSWAWCQLSALDSLLLPLTVDRSDDDESRIATAVRAVLVPAMNALRQSEERAHKLQEAAGTSAGKRPRAAGDSAAAEGPAEGLR